MSTIYRVHWTPGTDRLLAVCHCGSCCEVDDPVAAWQWLLAHPEDHTGGTGGTGHTGDHRRSGPPAAVSAGDPDGRSI